jgi:CheY-like chemotaxis protein/anti-sigma regulatory factor (Ser/Thr protein kinase)
MMRPVAEAKGLEFTVHRDSPLPLRFETDSLRLRQMLVNLLSNAVKYTDQGRIDLHLLTRVSDDKQTLELEISIRDTGVGIEPDAMEMIFEPFIQAERNSRSGTGLGLSITRSFARMLGGDILVESKPGYGSCFTLIMKSISADMVEFVPPERFDLEHRRQRNFPGGGACLGGRLIQLVEDSSAIAGLVRHLLVEAGAEVRYAENGEEGTRAVLEAVRSERAPDLIIMDMQMPVMDGYTATMKLRKMDIKVPIVALTAFTLSEDHEKCLAAGCDAYLTKPIDPTRFVAQIAACLES